MVQLSMLEACEAMGADLVRGDGALRFDGACLDSRAVVPGQLFFALEGAQTDGHRFASKALEAGAAGVVVRDLAACDLDSLPEDSAVLVVEDTFKALHALTRAVRSRVPRELVAITGSAGKTTTKELLTHMLAQRWRTAPSPGNLNNLFGFPLALLSIPDDTEWMVAEMGMSTPGELGGVSRLGRPDVAIFTNVRHAHVEAFEEALEPEQDDVPPEALIADAKAELLEGLDPDGLVIVNLADPYTVDIGKRHLARGKGRVVGFALQRDREDLIPAFPLPLHARLLHSDANGHRLLLGVQAEPHRPAVEVRLPLHGLVNVENFLAAATCAYELGVSLEQIADAVTEVGLPPGRGGVRRVGEVILIDDSYNSNPSALEQALRAAVAIRGEGGRVWAVLGEMKELGSHAARLHREAGELAGALGFDRVVGVGEMARDLLSGASGAGTRVSWFEDADSAVAVANEVRAGDVVLVKGSRSVGLEKVAEAIRKRAELVAEATAEERG